MLDVRHPYIGPGQESEVSLMDSIYHILIPGVLGLIGGAIGSLIAPWVNWGIEKRREKLNRRRKFIISWRRFIGSAEFNPQTFADTLTYTTLEPYLLEETKALIENKADTDEQIKRRLLKEITRIEKEWGIV